MYKRSVDNTHITFDNCGWSVENKTILRFSIENKILEYDATGNIVNTDSEVYFDLKEFGKWDVFVVSGDKKAFIVRDNSDQRKEFRKVGFILIIEDKTYVIPLTNFPISFYSMLIYYKSITISKIGDVVVVDLKDHKFMEDASLKYIFRLSHNSIIFEQWLYRPNKMLYLSYSNINVLTVYANTNKHVSQFRYLIDCSIQHIVFILPSIGLLTFKPKRTKIKFDTISLINPYSQKLTYISFGRDHLMKEKQPEWAFNKLSNFRSHLSIFSCCMNYSSIPFVIFMMNKGKFHGESM